MNTKNLSTLKIHKLTQAQYDRELAAGNIDEDALYLTPDEGVKTFTDGIKIGKAYLHYDNTEDALVISFTNEEEAEANLINEDE